MAAQVSNDVPDVEAWIDRLFPVQEEAFDYDDVYDRLFSLHREPVELNSATAEEIEGLIMLSESQIMALLQYRKSSGPLLSVYELPMLPGWDMEAAMSVLPFVRIDPPEAAGAFRKPPARHWIMLRGSTRLPLSAGYNAQDTEDVFQGPPFGLTMRYRLAGQKYEAGVTIDQDAGEAYAWLPRNGRYGLDYYSIFGMVKKIGILDRLVIGNYAVQFGQGLVFGSGWRRGKGTDPLLATAGAAGGIRPYGSTFENRDFQGAAATLVVANMELTGFWSDVRRDAVPVEDTLGDESWYTSYIRTAGLHRNEKELATRHTVRDRSFGANLRYVGRDRNLKIGTGLLITNYNIPVLPAPKEYNQYAFSGRHNVAGTLYGSYVIDRFHFFGEASRSGNGGTAFIGGLRAGLNSIVHMSLHLRKYAPDFQSLYGRAFGENTLNSNESGLYVGFRILPAKGWQINLFYDRFRFPWLRYNADAPSTGDEFMLAATHHFSHDNHVQLQIRLKNKERNHRPDGRPVNHLEMENRMYARLDWTKSPESGFWYRSRVQFLEYAFTGISSYGFLLAQDIGYRKAGRYALTGRAAWFRTDDWNSRQFIFEHGTLYSYSVPAFYGHGLRFYALLTMHSGRKWTFWLKAGYTRFFDREYAGSGVDMRVGNRDGDISTQVRYRF
jgi:hypothetical protein